VFYYASKIAWFFATPSNLLPALVAVGLVLMAWRRARRPGFALAALGTLAIFVAGLSPVANWVVLPLEQRFPAYRDDGQPVTGVIVLGGALESEVADRRGQVTLNEAGERLTAMADLARRYPDARIVFTGGGSTILRDELSEAVALQRFAGSLGIAPERILFETEPAPPPRTRASPGVSWNRSRASAGSSSPQPSTCPARSAASARRGSRSWPIRWISAPADRRIAGSRSISSPRVCAGSTSPRRNGRASRPTASSARPPRCFPRRSGNRDAKRGDIALQHAGRL
jgi:hypothetical protein